MSRSSQCLHRLRPALAVIVALVLLPCPAVHAAEIQGVGLRLPGLGEILLPLVDFLSRAWEKEGSGLDPSGSPREEARQGLDPNGAPAAESSEEGSGLDPDGAR